MPLEARNRIVRRPEAAAQPPRAVFVGTMTDTEKRLCDTPFGGDVCRHVWQRPLPHNRLQLGSYIADFCCLRASARSSRWMARSTTSVESTAAMIMARDGRCAAERFSHSETLPIGEVTGSEIVLERIRRSRLAQRPPTPSAPPRKGEAALTTGGASMTKPFSATATCLTLGLDAVRCLCGTAYEAPAGRAVLAERRLLAMALRGHRPTGLERPHHRLRATQRTAAATATARGSLPTIARSPCAARPTSSSCSAPTT